MRNSKIRCIARFSHLVDKLCKLKLFSSKDSNCAKKHCDSLIQSSEWKDKFDYNSESLMIESIHSSLSSCSVIQNSNAVGKYLS